MENACWISPFHKTARIPMHFVWLLLAMFFSFPLYISIFLFVRYRERPVGVTSESTVISESSSSNLSKLVDVAAVRMLSFPVAYFVTGGLI